MASNRKIGGNNVCESIKKQNREISWRGLPPKLLVYAMRQCNCHIKSIKTLKQILQESFLLFIYFTQNEVCFKNFTNIKKGQIL